MISLTSGYFTQNTDRYQGAYLTTQDLSSNIFYMYFTTILKCNVYSNRTKIHHVQEQEKVINSALVEVRGSLTLLPPNGNALPC